MEASETFDFQPCPVSVEQGDGVTVIRIELLAGRLAVRIAVGSVSERTLYAESSSQCQHRLHLTENRSH